ncbi:MAG: PIN domain-containing protein [Desulfobacterales bacterium]
MPDPESFIDTNILIYLLSEDTDKTHRAEEIVRAGGRISVQVLNELANVARRKLAMPWKEIEELLDLIQAVCTIDSLTVEIHERGMAVAEQYNLSFYDSLIVAAALLGKCNILYSEDMQDGLLIDQRLRIYNPFLRP